MTMNMRCIRIKLKWELNVSILSLIIFFNCSAEYKYELMLRKELASGKQYDSLFLGIRFGMSSKEFYNHCWKLNKDKLIKQGSENNTVLYKIKNFKYPTNMNFYPTFQNDKIVRMPVSFTYASWSPWNRDTFSSKLVIEVKSLMEKWYGIGFLELEDEKGLPLWVKIDGNRKIQIKIISEKDVRVDFTDLSKTIK